MVNKRLTLLLATIFVVLSVSVFVWGFPNVQNIFPTTDIVTSNDTINISYGINDNGEGINSITHSWNGTNYTFIDENLVLWMNFDNRSELGEYTNGSSEATCGLVRDLSRYNNNGTVIGCNSTAGFVAENISWGSTYGYNSGGFDWNGKRAMINISDADVLANNYTSMTWGFWIKNKISSDLGIIGKYSIPQRSYRIYTLGSSTIISLSDNLTVGTSYTDGNSCGGRNNIWVRVDIVYNGTSLKWYRNGELCYTNNSVIQNKIINNDYPLYIGAEMVNSFWYNGSIDDVMIWNRSLSSSEVSQLYKTQVTKYNESYYQYNVTNLSTSIYPQPHFLCSTNSTADLKCLASKTIRSNDYVNANFSTSRDIIKDNFYGVNDLHAHILNEKSMLDTNGDSILDTYSDYTYNRNLYYNSNMNYIKIFINLNQISLSEGVFNLTGNPTYSYPLGGINMIKEDIKYAHDNGQKLYIGVVYMPEWLQNKSGYCNTSGSGTITCPPNNYTKYGNTIADLMGNITEDGLYGDIIDLQILNEPWSATGFMNNLSIDSLTKAVEYIQIYNTTYDIVKSRYPQIAIGGVSGYNLAPNMTGTFLSNMSNKMDFFSYHLYAQDSYVSEKRVKNELFNIQTNCTTYSANCSRIIFSEIGLVNSYLKTNSFYAKEVSYVYLDMLNYPNSNLTTLYFEWGDRTNYSSGMKYPIIYEPKIGNEILPPYNITKSFAHLCPAGGTVYVSSGDDDSIKQVSCKKDNQYSLIIINTGEEARNLTLNLSMINGTIKFPYKTLVNYEDEDIKYKVSDLNTIELGVLDSYGILYLRSGEESGATLRGLFKLNEYSGNTLYDSNRNISNGTKSGASWTTDSVLNLVPSSNYTTSALGSFTILNSNYYFSYMMTHYTYQLYSTAGNAIRTLISGTGSFADFWAIIVIAIVIVFVLLMINRIFDNQSRTR